MTKTYACRKLNKLNGKKLNESLKRSELANNTYYAGQSALLSEIKRQLEENNTSSETGRQEIRELASKLNLYATLGFEVAIC